MKVQFLDAARSDLREAVRYYESRQPGLGRSFRDEVKAVIDRIAALPEAWHPLGENIRRCRTHRFPYGVIYQIRGDEEILIVAIAHLHREPGTWTERI